MQPAEAPADGLQVLKEGLARMRRGPGAGGARAVAAVEIDCEHTGPAIPVYTIGLNDLANGRGMDSARLIGWQYLLLNGDNVQRAAEIYPSEAAGQSRFGSLTNAFAEGTEQAIAVAEELDAVKDPSAKFELRLLRVPALFVTSLWLKGLNKSDDLFVVVPPTPDSLRPLVKYDTKTLLDTLKGAAQHRLGGGQATGPRVGGGAPKVIVRPGPAASGPRELGVLSTVADDSAERPARRERMEILSSLTEIAAGSVVVAAPIPRDTLAIEEQFQVWLKRRWPGPGFCPVALVNVYREGFYAGAKEQFPTDPEVLKNWYANPKVTT